MHSDAVPYPDRRYPRGIVVALEQLGETASARQLDCGHKFPKMIPKSVALLRLCPELGDARDAHTHLSRIWRGQPELFAMLPHDPLLVREHANVATRPRGAKQYESRRLVFREIRIRAGLIHCAAE